MVSSTQSTDSAETAASVGTPVLCAHSFYARVVRSLLQGQRDVSLSRKESGSQNGLMPPLSDASEGTR